MNAIGIIAEYNPFHNGHAYQIREAKRIAGDVIAAISGSFVQRGEPACADKFLRAEWALRGGADLVIELPDVLSSACAERFAAGGVRLLAGTGIAGGICFGSESGNIEVLRQAASVELPREKLRDALARGLSYPAAAAEGFRAAGIRTGILKPNDILAIEYLRAIKRFAPGFRAFAVKRQGAPYNETTVSDAAAADISPVDRAANNTASVDTAGASSPEDTAPESAPSGANSADRWSDFASAAAIRGIISSADTEAISKIKRYVPGFVHGDIMRLLEAGRLPAELSALSPVILYSLRNLGKNGIRALADVSEGLENVFLRAAYAAGDASELLGMVKTKRYTMARLKRIFINALLNTTEELQRMAANGADSLFIRVLGIRRTKLYLLSEMKRLSALPVITRYSELSALNSGALRIAEHTRLASAVRALACPRDKALKDDFSHPLVII